MTPGDRRMPTVVGGFGKLAVIVAPDIIKFSRDCCELSANKKARIFQTVKCYFCSNFLFHFALRLHLYYFLAYFLPVFRFRLEFLKLIY